jgi:hypothetical protein
MKWCVSVLPPAVAELPFDRVLVGCCGYALLQQALAQHMRGFLGAQNSHRYDKFEAQTLTTAQTSLTAMLIGAVTVTRSFSASAPLPAATHFGHTILRAYAHAIGMVYAKGREPCFAQGRSFRAPLFNLRQTLGFLSSALPRHCAVILHGLAPRMSLSAEPGPTWRLHCNPLNFPGKFVKSEKSSLTVVFGCQDHKARFLPLFIQHT